MPPAVWHTAHLLCVIGRMSRKKVSDVAGLLSTTLAGICGLHPAPSVTRKAKKLRMVQRIMACDASAMRRRRAAALVGLPAGAFRRGIAFGRNRRRGAAARQRAAGRSLPRRRQLVRDAALSAVAC